MNNAIDIKDARILVAEDNKLAIQEIAEWLTDYGYQHIELTRSEKECLEKLSQQSFDIIVADMRMETSSSGFAILDAVRDRNITSAVIIFTANDTVEGCRRAFRSGAWDYISKSWPNNVFDELDSSIRDALTYFDLWGDRRDEIWIREQMESLRETYAGQYIAVLNQSVLEAANSREELEQHIKERKLPLYLTVIEKIDAPLVEPLQAELTVFVEGPTDVKYIHYAAKLLDKEALLDRIHLDTVGTQDGQKGSGYQALNQGFNFLRDNPNLHPHKVLFLFDQDVTDKQIANKGKDFENLFVRRIADPDPDKKGIEYLLSQKIHEEGFQNRFVKIDRGREMWGDPIPAPSYIIREKSKMKLCEWVCNVRVNQPEEFAAFQPIFHIFESLLDDTYGMA